MTTDEYAELRGRVEDLESKIEKNVRFSGLPRWARIVDGAAMWTLTIILGTMVLSFLHHFFPFIQ